MIKFGIGIGRNTHTLVMVDVQPDQEPKVVVTEQYVPNSYSGAMDVVSIVSSNGNPRQVVFTGNIRWGTPFAAMLRNKDIEPFYYRFMAERGQRGRVGNVAKSLVTILTTGVRSRPYFLQKQTVAEGEAEKLPHTHRVALEYLKVTDQVRQTKHHVLDGLVVLFPECVRSEGRKVGGETLPVPQPQPPGLFTKGMQLVLANPDPFELDHHYGVPVEVRVLAANSLGRWVPQDFRAQVMSTYQCDLTNYYAQLERKETKMAELRELMAEHPLVVKYGGGDIITVVAALIGWRTWPYWRELRRYCGLDVSRLDSTGKPRISRVRPQIRQYLYLFMSMTKVGKEMAAEVTNVRQDGTKRTHLRVKRLEHVLKAFWRECLLR
ncbi:MAG: hypothetical protein HYT38_01705 [Candidatus Sungbacteria bacterium]|uniref:Uncharacterized protein n=1 Tax=Candidatus Sungiibacteriota bacterium TaxID=2750080 RepID=A0A931YD60_9BACT|nr:hypothetical protein [Candidatus Sungbacteria bacterium]MBI2465699.1 hypothetical protein [Candidatus Sungbacteria bacterium]